MRRSQKDFDRFLFGCLGVVTSFFVVCASFGASPIVRITVITVIGIGIYLWFASEAKKNAEEAKRRRQAELIEKESKRIAEIKDMKHELVTEDDLNFLYWGSRLPDIEIKKLCVDLLNAGKRYAIGPLLGTSERIIKDLPPLEVINECDAIIDLIPNARSFYYKGMALKQLKRYDEAIIEIQNAIVIDQSENSPELKFLGYNLKIAEKELSQIKVLAHRMHIEGDGDFNLVKTGTEYEKFVCGIFRRQGCSCKRVGKSGDYGADILVDVGSGTLVIQCKFYSTPVGYEAIQQVYAAKTIYKGTWCCVVSNATFTRQAIDGGRKLGVKLLSHIDIVKYLNALKDHC